MGGAAIGIICKVPRPDTSNNWLIPTLGPERAAALSRAFPIDLAATIHGLDPDLGARGYAVCSPAEAAQDVSTVFRLPVWYDIDDEPSFGWLLDELGGRRTASVDQTIVAGEGRATRALLTVGSEVMPIA